MEQGTIARIMNDKGYGFINKEGESQGIFFHANDVSGAQFDDLSEGDAVTFEVEEGQKGPRAVNVTQA